MSKVERGASIDTNEDANEKIYRQNYDDDESLEGMDPNGFVGN